MIPMTPHRDPVVVTDPMEQFLLTHADPRLTAPEVPLIVMERCDGNLGEFITFWSLSHLATLYKSSGRKDFTVEEIGRYAKGISRGRIPTYLRGLCDKGLVDVVGHREIRGFHRENWTALYHIDLDRLRHESMPVAVGHLGNENQPPPLRRITASPGQLGLHLITADDPPAEETGTGSGPHAPTEVGTPHRAPPALILGGRQQRHRISLRQQDARRQHPTMRATSQPGSLTPEDAAATSQPSRLTPEDAAATSQPGSLTPEDAAATSQPGHLTPEDAAATSQPSRLTPEDAGSQHRRMRGIEQPSSLTSEDAAAREQPSHLTPEDAGSQHRRMRATEQPSHLTPEDAVANTVGCVLPTPEDAVGGGEVGKDVSKEVCEERAAPAITPAVMNLDSLRAIMQAEIGQAIKEAIATLTLSPRTTFPLTSPELHEHVPPPPPDEPAVAAGPRATWVALVGRDLTGRDAAQMDEHIRRYDAPSGGHSAYWLTRALVTASMQDDTPLTLNYAGGILRRMAKAGVWTTAELVRQPHETLRETVAPPPSPAEAEKVARGKPRPSEAEKVAPSGPAQPEHPAIIMYTTAFRTKLNDVQRQQITATITNLDAWKKVLDDWQANGWKDGAVAKMIDRYLKETGTVPASSAAPLTKAIIHDHPDLTPEERSSWLLRYHHATTPADKQAVLARFAKEYPDVRP